MASDPHHSPPAGIVRSSSISVRQRASNHPAINEQLCLIGESRSSTMAAVQNPPRSEGTRTNQHRLAHARPSIQRAPRLVKAAVSDPGSPFRSTVRSTMAPSGNSTHLERWQTPAASRSKLRRPAPVLCKIGFTDKTQFQLG
ncbi:hypothetical protein ACLOJK_002165 [Asimina triloba]